MRCSLWLLSLSVASIAYTLLSAPIAAAAEPDPSALEFFEKEVRPILVSRCYDCHSSKNEEPKGGLRVDSLAALTKGGETGPGVVPGKPKDSLLIDAVNYGDLYQMPPKGKMPAAEIATLTKWVEMGAPWPAEKDPSEGRGKGFDIAARKAEHWAWRPLQKPEFPGVKNEAWIRQPSDRFILAKLEAAGLSPAPPADKRTLVRRVYFDLIGLPPTPDEVQAYLQDESPQALEKVVDRLLESPHFGERWGRHWLDLMRYAESRGHEFDYTIPGAWQYRDYVIRALNADVPYDQFVREHVAGDLLPTPRLNPNGQFNESILGTGFWFLGEWIHSPVDIRKDETDRYDNMVDVFSKSFLGLTVSCARCHDHKFDAISQQDYYALVGYLQSSSHRLIRYETHHEEQRQARELAELHSVYAVLVGDAIGDETDAGASEVERYLLAARETLMSGQSAANVCREQSLSEPRLEAWLKEVTLAKKDPNHVLHAWSLLCDRPANETERVSEVLSTLGAAKDAIPYDGEWIADYANLPRSEWFASGVTFGLSPALPSQLKLIPTESGIATEVQTYGAARRDPTWNHLKLAGEQEAGRLGFPRAGRTLKTKTFVVKSGLVHYLVKGAGQIYAAVDSHSMINGPLHGALVKETGGDGSTPPRWISHDLKPYIGHTAHLEFTPKDNDDLQILAVAEGAKPPAGVHPVNHCETFVRHLPAAETRSVVDLANAYQQRFREAVLTLQTGVADPTTRQLLAPFAQLVVHHRALWLPKPDTSSIHGLLEQYQQARKRLVDKVPAASQVACAMWDGSGEDEHLLVRGNSSAKTTGPKVPRRLLSAIESEFPAPPEQAPVLTASGTAAAPTTVPVGSPLVPGAITGSGRLQLADKLVDPRNPFPSRVMVNRLWHHLFGRGIVPSVDNFGVLGQAPTHPELLDHLALEFIADGWSVKRAIKRMVLSNAYQMASGGPTIDPPQLAMATQRDPQNELLHKANLRRLEGEVIRDAMLHLSGRLDRRQFGPSVATFLTPFMQGRGRPASGPVDGEGRRSIYLGVRRNFLSPMMLAFDVPNPASTIGRRNVSNVPAQALILMNDPLVQEQARLWAKQVLASAPASTEGRIQRLYEQAFSRPASAEETTAAVAFLEAQAKEYGLTADRIAGDERPWGDLCHVLINGKEFVFVR